MREQGREMQTDQVRRQLPRAGDSLTVLIQRHGNEHISTLAQLISLTTRVENSQAHKFHFH